MWWKRNRESKNTDKVISPGWTLAEIEKRGQQIIKVSEKRAEEIIKKADSCQEFCVWFTSFLPNLKLKSCNISYSLTFKFITGFFHLPSLKFSQIK